MKIIPEECKVRQMLVSESWENLQIPQFEIKRSGYLYAFVSNQTDIPVWFDDIKIEHWDGSLVQETNYYPFGLPFGPVAQFGAVANNILYNSQQLERDEWDNGDGLNWYDFEARNYDVQIGRWMGMDPKDQFASPYLAMGNNPVSFTDPDGRFVKHAFMALATIANTASNLLDGNSLSSSFKNGFNDARSFTNAMANCMQYTILRNDNMSLSIGIDPFAIGVSANFGFRTGDLSGGISGGFGLGGWNASGGLTYSPGHWEISAGAGIGNNHSGYGGSMKFAGIGAGYYRTHYGSATGPDGISNSQDVGGLSLFIKDASIRVENDFLMFISNSGDRWRTGALEFGYKDFVAGFSVYTNNPGDMIDPENPMENVDMDGMSAIWRGNRGNFGAWKHGQVLGSSIYVGSRSGNTVSKIGVSSRLVQDLFQNSIHKFFPLGRQNFYNRYDYLKEGVNGYFGYYNPYSLYGK